MKNQGYVPRLPVNPEDMADSDKVKDRVENRNLKAFRFYHKKDNYKVVDIVLVHPLDFEKSFKNRTVKRVNDVEIYLASIDDVIKTKEFSGRAQDICDIEMLKKVRKYLGCRDAVGDGQMALDLKMASKAFIIICGAELAKPYMLPESLGRNPVRENDGIEGRGTGKKISL